MLRRAQGFTVMELTVVLAVVALLAALTAPHYAALRDSIAVRSATTDLVQSLALARRTALATHQNTSAVFDTAGGRVLIRSAGQALTGHNLTASYGILLGTDRDSLVYDPRGFGYGASNLTLTVRRGNAVDSVVVSRLGRLRW